MEKVDAKVDELMSIFKGIAKTHNDIKKGVLILVEEIINAIPMYIGHINPKWEFWQQVKQQVNIK